MFKKISMFILATAMLCSMAVTVNAEDFKGIDIGQFVATDGEFRVPESGRILTHRQGLTEIPLEYRSMEYWNDIDGMKISFIITDTVGDADPDEVWVTFYLQQPNSDDVVDNIDKWTWEEYFAQNKIDNGEMVFGKEYTFVLDIAENYHDDKNFMGTIGFQIGNKDLDDMFLHIEFTDVELGKLEDFADVRTFPIERKEAEAALANETEETAETEAADTGIVLIGGDPPTDIITPANENPGNTWAYYLGGLGLFVAVGGAVYLIVKKTKK
ncbi:MAG: hypothetical protein FWD34_04440 [Oscillospiraceae bacterium]|nr:hypothetical protein [Oscillospiraceae bacterium]